MGVRDNLLAKFYDKLQFSGKAPVSFVNTLKTALEKGLLDQTMIERAIEETTKSVNENKKNTS